MYTHRITTQLPAQLTDGLHEGRTLNVANGAAHLGDDKIKFFVLLVLAQHTALNLIRDMRYHLNGLSQIVAMTLTIDNSLVDTARGNRVVTGGMDACKAFIVTKVEIGLHAIYRHITLTVLVGVQCARVDVDIGVEFLNSDLIAACLQQFTDAGGDDSLTK